MIQHTKVQDIIREKTSDIENMRKKYRYKEIRREEVLALRFKKGQVLRDKITGEVVEVYAGTRTRISKV